MLRVKMLALKQLERIMLPNLDSSLKTNGGSYANLCLVTKEQLNYNFAGLLIH